MNRIGDRIPHRNPGLLTSLFTHRMQQPVIALTVNGQPRSFSAPLNVSALVGELGFAGKRIALERNGEIVPRSQFDATELADGDALEIVVAVGGG